MNIPTPPILQDLNVLASKVMRPEEMRFFTEHVKQGAPGLPQYLASEKAEKALRALINDYLNFLSDPTGREIVK